MELANNIKYLALPKTERRQLAQFFGKLLKFFLQNDVIAVATAGTLLNLIRNGDFLEYDDDIDMRLNRQNLEKLQNLFVDDKFTFKDGTSKTTYKLMKIKKNQYSIHPQEKHRLEWPFVNLYVGEIGPYTDRVFTLKNNSNRPITVNIEVN